MHSISHRPAFVEAHPELQDLHREAQCALFGAAHAMSLPTDEAHKDIMLDAINEAFNRKGSRRLISRKQLKIEEMEALTCAIEAGLFSPDWTWGHDFMIYIRTATVTAAIPTDVVRMRFSSTHLESLQSESARQWSQSVRPTMVSPLR